MPSNRFLFKQLPFIALVLLILFQLLTNFVFMQYSVTWSILFFEWMVIAGIPFGIYKFFRIPRLDIFPFQPIDKRRLFWTVIMTLALAVLIDYLMFLSRAVFPPPPEVEAAMRKLMAADSLSVVIWKVFLICLTPAVCEELFFRGMFQNFLNKDCGRKWSFILTGLFFALIHMIPWYWHLYLILGLYLSWLMMVGKNLWLPIIAHFINNSWTFTNYLLKNKIPSDNVWHTTDTLVFAVALIVFFLAASRFKEARP